jgi:hypothetical protein
VSSSGAFCQEVDVILQALVKAKRGLDISLAAFGRPEAGYRNMVDLLECYGAAASALKTFASAPQVELAKGFHHAEHVAAQNRFETHKTRTLNDLAAEINRLKVAGEQEKRGLKDSGFALYRQIFGFVVVESDGSVSVGRCVFTFFAGLILAGMAGISGWACFWTGLAVPVSSWLAAEVFGGMLEHSKLRVDAKIEREAQRLTAAGAAEIGKFKAAWDKERQQIDTALNQRLVQLDKLIEQEDSRLAGQARQSQQNLQGWATYYSGLVADAVKKGGAPDPPTLLHLGVLSVNVP